MSDPQASSSRYLVAVWDGIASFRGVTDHVVLREVAATLRELSPRHSLVRALEAKAHREANGQALREAVRACDALGWDHPALCVDAATEGQHPGRR